MFTPEKLAELTVKYPDYYGNVRPLPDDERIPQRVRDAFDELIKIGCPTYGNWCEPHRQYGPWFAIGGEPRTVGDKYFASYYEPEMIEGEADEFGIAKVVNDILDKHGLMAEWYDAGTVIVNDI